MNLFRQYPVGRQSQRSPVCTAVVRFGFALLLTVSLAAAGEPSYADKLAALQKQLTAQPTNTAVLYELGDLCHDEGGEGNADAVKLAEKYLRELLELQTNHTRGLALLGSTMTMKARDAFWPTTRLSYAREGIRLMDQAVALSPDDPEVRMTRGVNNVHMPKYMGREKTAHDDFAWLWSLTQKTPEQFTDHFRQKTAFYYGEALNRLRQTAKAIEVWKEGLAIDPNSSYGARIQKNLAKAGKS